MEEKRETWIRCKKCNTLISVNTNYIFTECTCGAVAVDGGKEYCRVIGEIEDWELLSKEGVGYGMRYSYLCRT